MSVTMLSVTLLSPMSFHATHMVTRARLSAPTMMNGLPATWDRPAPMQLPSGVARPASMSDPVSGSFVRCDDDGCELVEDLAPITAEDVQECQTAWANAIQSISKTYLDKGDYVGAAAEAAGELYGYGHTKVLFKPTKATDNPFRGCGESAMSYFVGGTAVDNGLEEDAGFAINGGKGWSKVVFKNSEVDYSGNIAIAMGTYWFTCATTGEETRVEYTFGYKRCDDGKPRIFLHHSSVPYKA